MRLFIEPSDVLLFRSSRPFNAGESGYLESQFPPAPETVQGAIRARIAACWNPNLSEAFKDKNLTTLIGRYDKVGQFRLRGLTLGRRDERDRNEVTPLFPAPAHLLRGEDSKKVYRLAPREPEQGIQTNMPGPMERSTGPAGVPLWLLHPEGGYPHEKLEDFKGWLTLKELSWALGDNAEEVQRIEGVASKELYELEPRLGIGMNNESKTTREGLLYQISFVRMKPGVGFLVDVGLADAGSEDVEPERVQETLKLPKQGWLALGGERRAASFEVLGPAPSQTQPALASGEQMCVYFSTPASFTSGWKPKDWQATFGAVPIAAAVSQAKLIGGWQQEPANADGKPKLLRRCVPAGSVYFFRSPIKSNGPFTDYGQEIGYGIAYKGVWSHV
jgi:CRISPR-associated protein Cmr3